MQIKEERVINSKAILLPEICLVQLNIQAIVVTLPTFYEMWSLFRRQN